MAMVVEMVVVTVEQSSGGDGCSGIAQSSSGGRTAQWC